MTLYSAPAPERQLIGSPPVLVIVAVPVTTPTEPPPDEPPVDRQGVGRDVGGRAVGDNLVPPEARGILDRPFDNIDDVALGDRAEDGAIGAGFGAQVDRVATRVAHGCGLPEHDVERGKGLAGDGNETDKANRQHPELPAQARSMARCHHGHVLTFVGRSWVW